MKTNTLAIWGLLLLGVLWLSSFSASETLDLIYVLAFLVLGLIFTTQLTIFSIYYLQQKPPSFIRTRNFFIAISLFLFDITAIAVLWYVGGSEVQYPTKNIIADIVGNTIFTLFIVVAIPLAYASWYLSMRKPNLDWKVVLKGLYFLGLKIAILILIILATIGLFKYAKISADKDSTPRTNPNSEIILEETWTP